MSELVAGLVAAAFIELALAILFSDAEHGSERWIAFLFVARVGEDRAKRVRRDMRAGEPVVVVAAHIRRYFVRWGGEIPLIHLLVELLQFLL